MAGGGPSTGASRGPSPDDGSSTEASQFPIATTTLRLNRRGPRLRRLLREAHVEWTHLLGGVPTSIVRDRVGHRTLRQKQ